jgi:hypothetical protein
VQINTQGFQTNANRKAYTKQVFELINFQAQNPREESQSPPSEQKIKLTPSQLIRHHNQVSKPKLIKSGTLTGERKTVALPTSIHYINKSTKGVSSRDFQSWFSCLPPILFYSCFLVAILSPTPK